MFRGLLWLSLGSPAAAMRFSSAGNLEKPAVQVLERDLCGHAAAPARLPRGCLRQARPGGCTSQAAPARLHQPGCTSQVAPAVKTGARSPGVGAVVVAAILSRTGARWDSKKTNAQQKQTTTKRKGGTCRPLFSFSLCSEVFGKKRFERPVRNAGGGRKVSNAPFATPKVRSGL